MRLSKLTCTDLDFIPRKLDLYPKQVIEIEYVESTDLSNIYYKKHKVTLEMTTDTDWSYHDYTKGKFRDQRLTNALASFEHDYAMNKSVDYNLKVSNIEVCEATNVEEYFKVLEDSGWKRDEDILKPAWQIRAERAGWTAPKKD